MSAILRAIGRYSVTEYSDEQVKAQALAALMAGQSYTQVSVSLGVPVGTLKSWKSRQRRGDAVATVATDKRERIGALLLEYLETALETLITQQKVFRDETWLYKQSAGEAALLHRDSLAGAVRLLEGLAEQGESHIIDADAD